MIRNLYVTIGTNERFKAYRTTLHEAAKSGPVVPYILVSLQDLTITLDPDVNPDVYDGRLVNVSKYQLAHRLISEMERYQKLHFNFTEVPELRRFFDHFPAFDDSVFYALSLRREPRVQQ